MKARKETVTTTVLNIISAILFGALLWLLLSGCTTTTGQYEPRPAIVDENRWVVTLPAGTVLSAPDGIPRSIVRLLDETDAALQDDGSLVLERDLILTTTAYIQHRDQVELELLQRIEELRIDEQR